MQVSPVAGSAAVNLRDFFSLVWRKKWLIAAVTAVVVAAAVAFSLRQTPIYEAKASVLVEPTAAANGGTPTPPNMSTEKLVASSPAVATNVADTLHLSARPLDLLANLSVDVPVETEVLDFTYADPDPEKARQLAMGFAEGYLDFRKQKQTTDSQASRRAVQAQLDALNKSLQQVNAKASASRAGSQSQQVLQAQAGALSSQMFLLQEQLAQLDLSSQVSPGRIVRDASTPTRPARPNHVTNGVLGVFVGLLLGFGAMVLQEYLGDRIKGSKDLESHVGAPVLSAIPTVRGGRDPAAALVTMQQPESVAAEAFRQLRTNFAIAAGSRDAKTILVTSAREQEGKTFTAANLGVVLASAGSQVILLSADLRRPRLEGLFDISAPHGLVDALGEARVRNGDGDEHLPAGIGMWSIKENLTIVPVGTVPDHPTELLGSSNLSAFIKELREMADFVLVDAAPLLPVADAATMATSCDAVLMVADARSTTRTNVAEARERLERIHAKVLGAVLVNAPGNVRKTYGKR
jgi:succinoglycan biosynthesis transport protein ExoP